jgi:hypothetical protein
MGENIISTWDLRECRVQVNCPCPIPHERDPIRWVITPIRGLLNSITQVVLLISHSRLYPAYHGDLHPPSLPFLFTNLPSSHEHIVNSFLSVSPCQDHELKLSTAYTEYSINQVQHTREIVCCPFILTISSWPLHVAPATSVPPYRSTATSQFSIWASNANWPCHIPTVSS